MACGGWVAYMLRQLLGQNYGRVGSSSGTSSGRSRTSESSDVSSSGSSRSRTSSDFGFSIFAVNSSSSDDGSPEVSLDAASTQGRVMLSTIFEETEPSRSSGQETDNISPTHDVQSDIDSEFEDLIKRTKTFEVSLETKIEMSENLSNETKELQHAQLKKEIPEITVIPPSPGTVLAKELSVKKCSTKGPLESVTFTNTKLHETELNKSLEPVLR